MTTWEHLETRRMMSATVVTAATITADQQAITAAHAALTATLSADAKQLSNDRSTMHDEVLNAQLSLQTDKSVFAQTFADDQSAFALKLAADHQVLSADAQLLHASSPAAVKAQYQSDLQQMKNDVHTAAATIKAVRAQAKSTLSHDTAAIAAAKASGLATLRADTVAAAKHKVFAAHAIVTAEAKLRADQHTLASTKK